MKTIHLLRHAKSSWSDPDLSDRDRPLNTRGKRGVLLMIEPIWKAGCRFENVYTSPAKRARHTIRRISKSLNGEGIFWTTDEDLYTFEVEDLLRWLREQDDATDNLMLVGHNPAITELANLLGDQAIEHVPTCGYVQLEADISGWKKVKENCAETKAFLYPKMFDISE